MEFKDGLTVVTLVTATVALAMSCMALWPHCKGGLAVIRDALLWFVLVVVVTVFGFAGWRHARGPAATVDAPPGQSDRLRVVDEWPFESRSMTSQRSPASWPAPADPRGTGSVPTSAYADLNH